MLFISPTFYKKNKKIVYDDTVCPEKCCFFVNGNLFFSQHIVTTGEIHTQILFCCLKCPLATT